MSSSKFENILPRNVEEEMKESYLRYSMSVIISRALPDVRDGLKPSQRRILYAMRLLNLSPGGKHRKCAKICGDTSGDFHPHGEMVIYPTLVRMAQEWCMRYMLINGQGNFGSVDGDPPAQMRYTEARLTQPSVLLMEDLEKETVDLVPNYDETKNEPVVFPAKFPNLLANGSSGIAVGMATNIPPHNLTELIQATQMVLGNPKTTIDEIMQEMPGPDFPTGGIICGYRGIKEAYHTGRGKFMLRAKIEIEEKEGERASILVKELPYAVNKARLISTIANLIHQKAITGISDIRDESDKNGMQIVIELKRNENPSVIVNQLYKFTDLQVTFGCIMLALDKGLPRVMNIKHFITAWIDHRIEVIRRRTRYELNKAEDRAHILEGYLIALKHLDEVVKIIRSKESREEAKIALMKFYELSERQANAVLDLKLYQLTGLEQDKINDEYQKLLEKIKDLKDILASEQRVRTIIHEELDTIKSLDKIPRKTKIIAAEGDLNIEDLIDNEQVILTVSQDDYIKRMPIDTFKEQRRGGSGVIGFDLKKEHDALKSVYIANTHDYLLVFTSLGRCYWLKAWQIPEAGRRSKGKPLINLLEDIKPGEQIATLVKVSDFNQEVSVFLSTVKGIVKKTEISAFSNPRRKGIYAITIDEDDTLMNAQLVSKDQQVMLFSKNGMAIRFDEDQVRAMGRTARGVKGINLKSKDDKVVASEVVNGDEQILVVCEKGFGKRSNVEDFRKTNRGGVGVRSIIVNERNGDVLGALSIQNDESVLMMSRQGQTIRFGMDDLRVMGRATQGVKLAQLKEGDTISAIQKIDASSDEAEEEIEENEVTTVSESDDSQE